MVEAQALRAQCKLSKFRITTVLSIDTVHTHISFTCSTLFRRNTRRRFECETCVSFRRCDVHGFHEQRNVLTSSSECHLTVCVGVPAYSLMVATLYRVRASNMEHHGEIVGIA